MKAHTTRWATAAALISLAGFTWGWAEEPFAPDNPEEVIELAIVLDTSDSMKPLIDAARLTLWDVVNELTLLDPPPQLRVALLTYGNSDNDRDSGYVRVEVPLTTDLDLVSERLFALETKGGEEFVGRVLQAASELLAWTDSSETVKLVFIAGNESAEQDKVVDLPSAANDALGKDLQVHAVFCGQPQNPHAESWRALAELTDGQFAAIDHGTAALLVETPFDREMAELGAQLNKTYVPIGETGRGGLEVQAEQDKNAQSLSAASAATRAQTKAGPLYSQEWDLIDSVAAGRGDLYDIAEEDLPQVMQEMTNDEREAYIEELSRQRRDIREQIQRLSVQRRAHVAQQAAKKGIDESRTFDGVIRRAIRKQVEEKGFSPK